MSGTRGIETGPSDRGGKTMNDSEGKEKEKEKEEEEEDEEDLKSMDDDASQKQNPSSSSSSSNLPSEVGETKVSDKQNYVPSYGGENPSNKKQKQSDPFRSHDHPRKKRPPKSRFFRESSEGANQEVQPRATREDIESSRDPDSILDLREEDDEEDDIFLFEMQIPIDNILEIPTVIAAEYFPSLSCTGGQQNLCLEDFTGHVWTMPFTYNKGKESFTNTNEWQQITNLYLLISMDLIQFYRPAPRMHTTHYTIEFERVAEYQNRGTEFIVKDFLFELKLCPSDIGFARFFLPYDQVLEHFPAIFIPIGSQKTVTMKFTDAQRKNWYMDIVRYNEDLYMIIKWWDEFVRQHKLKAMDVIRFYKPMFPSHRKHFLIEIVKKDCGDDPNQPAIESCEPMETDSGTRDMNGEE